MSDFKVTYTTILDVFPHPNAERLEYVKVYGFDVIVQKDRYKVGDSIIYCPIDAILPKDLEEKLFPPTGKIFLNKSRVRQIKIRGYYSQGLIIDPDLLWDEMCAPIEVHLEADLSQMLNIVKYEPPATELPKGMGVKTSSKVQNPTFVKYTDIQNIKYYDRTLDNYPEVVATCKLHGTSARYSWEPYPVNTWWRKILSLLKLTPSWEFCWGSRQVQIQNKLMHKGYYDEDVYTKVLKNYDLKNRIPKGYGVYGEIVGPGIQAGYSYGIPEGHYGFYAYDVRKDGEWLSYDAARQFCQEHDIPYVPQMYRGPFNKEEITSLLGNNPISKEVNEGVVIKPTTESYSNQLGRVILKYINPVYLENKNNTEFH